VKFFFDNNLAIKLAHGLDHMVSPHHRVVHLRDEFLPNVEDAVWMNALAKEEDLVIITADVAISRDTFRLLPGFAELSAPGRCHLHQRPVCDVHIRELIPKTRPAKPDIAGKKK
jgi:hypothetical protein